MVKKLVLTMLIMVMAAGVSLAATKKQELSVQKEAIRSKLPAVGVPFLENRGRTGHESSGYYTRTDAGTVFVRDEDITYLFEKREIRSAGPEKQNKPSGKTTGWVIRESLLKAEKGRVEAADPAPAKVSRFRGKKSEWETDIPAYRELSFGEVYDHVRLNLRASGKSFEKIFIVEPGGNPRDITVRVEGATGLRLEKDGNLEIGTGIGTVKMTAPCAYQEIDGKKVIREAAYRLGADENTYGFRVGDYDGNYPLVIDPFLLASTFIGGNRDETLTGIALDHSGNIYITGYTYASYSDPRVDFPVTPGAYDKVIGEIESGDGDVFISKFDPNLTTLLASTFLGGGTRIDGSIYGWAPVDYGNALVIDASGNVFVCGSVGSRDFPVTEGAYRTEISRADAFIAKLNSNLSTLLASTTFDTGYWVNEWLSSMVFDASGNVYAAGGTDGSGTLPEGGYDNSGNGWTDALVVKFDNNLTTLLASTFLGGSQHDYARAIALDSSGNVFITGDTAASSYKTSDFPVTPGAYQTSYSGCKDSYIAKFSPNLATLLASTFIGGEASEVCGYTTSFGYTDTVDLLVDSSDNVYVLGTTDARVFPTTENAYDRTYNLGGNDSFAAKFDNKLATLFASTYLGGSGSDSATSLVLDNADNVYVAGYTSSPDFPTTAGAYDSEFGPNNSWADQDAFVGKLDGKLRKLAYATYIGGMGTERIEEMVLDSAGNVLVAGHTNASDYPTTAGAYDPTYNGTYDNDAFVSKVEIPKVLSADITGPTIVNPGQEITFLARYRNGMEVTGQDAVLVIDLPREFLYLSGTADVIYRNDLDRQQVFWKLGNVAPDANGQFTIKMKVPWGLPTGEGSITVNVGAKNSENPNIDINEYLNYEDIGVLSQTKLEQAEIDAVLSSDQPLRELLNYARDLGYLFYNQALRTEFSNGSYIVQFFMIDPEEYRPALLTSNGSLAFIEQYNGSRYKIFDKNGGYAADSKGGTFDSWGLWAESHSLTWARCQLNCTLGEIPDWIGSAISNKWDAVSSTYDCLICAWSKGENIEKCAQCTNGLVDYGENELVGPGIGYFIDVAACLDECLDDPNTHICTEDKKECGTTFFGQTGVYTTPCNKTFGNYGFFGSWIYCTEATGGKYCVDGQCVESPCEKASTSCGTKKFDNRVARDPNAKSVDFKGNVLPGQTLTYTIEYENVGAGTAYDVFILDELPTDLDDSDLNPSNGGDYSPATRLLSWDIGELPPCDEQNPDICKGSVSFKAKVKNDLPSGTEIVNQAEVHFPSADEITPTNPVASIVRTIAADPKTVETMSQTPVSVVLTGRDSGSKPLTYRITSDPLYGSLTGTPPNVTYTSMTEFSGQDEFYYVVNNGTTDSDPAKVTVIVNPNPADTNPPTVASTYPEKDADNVPTNSTPISTDPSQYAPTITATFSEPLDAATVDNTTFVVGGLMGTVYYDDQLKTASFIPSVPLEPSTTYTARLKTGIKDKVGNALASEYAWTFTTENPVHIAVLLPDHGEVLDFGDTSTDPPPKEKVVSIANAGTEDLTLGTLTVEAGVAASAQPLAVSEEFSIIEDTCSGLSLKSSQNCTVRVGFAPESLGAKTATLVIPSNDPDTPYKVSMKGNGVIPFGTFSLPLSKGWNLISLPLLPANTSVGSVFGELPCSIVWSYGSGWKMYDPDNPLFSDLKNVALGRGYWILMEQAGTLNIEGTIPTKTVRLSKGWNLVGYSSLNALPVADALNSVSGKYSVLWAFAGGDWQSYDPANPSGNLTHMNPGYGYWIKANEVCDWILP